VSRGQVRLQRFIGAPAAIVFQYLTNIERTPEWDRRVEKVTQMTRGPLRSGVILRSTLVADGESVHFDDEVTDFDPPSRFGVRSVLGNTNVATYTLAEDDSGRTLVDITLSYDLPEPPAGASLDEDSIRAAIASSLSQALNLLRDIVERDSTAAPTSS
jgi:uncharacterized membrane protein